MSGINFNDTDTRPIANVFIQTNNGTDTTSNLNFGTYTAVPIFTAIDSISNYTGEFTKTSDTQITVNFTGSIQGMANVAMISAGQRVSITASFFNNSTQVGALGCPSYIRNSNDANEGSSIILPCILPVSDGDIIDLRCARVSTITDSTFFVGNNTSYCTLQRFT